MLARGHTHLAQHLTRKWTFSGPLGSPGTALTNSAASRLGRASWRLLPQFFRTRKKGSHPGLGHPRHMLEKGKVGGWCPCPPQPLGFYVDERI